MTAQGDRPITESWADKIAIWDTQVAFGAQTQPCKTEGCPYQAQRPARDTEYCPICDDKQPQP